jgi:hypothetical protein
MAQTNVSKGIPFPLMINNTNKQETIFARAMREAQEQAVTNGTSEMSLDEINDLIKECRDA